MVVNVISQSLIQSLTSQEALSLEITGACNHLRLFTLMPGNISCVVFIQVSRVELGTINNGRLLYHFCIFATVDINNEWVFQTPTQYAKRPVHLFVRNPTHCFCVSVSENSFHL